METESEPVHYMTGSSSVRCGAPMRDPRHPDGWDLGTASVEWHRVTCEGCRQFRRRNGETVLEFTGRYLGERRDV